MTDKASASAEDYGRIINKLMRENPKLTLYGNGHKRFGILKYDQIDRSDLLDKKMSKDFFKSCDFFERLGSHINQEFLIKRAQQKLQTCSGLIIAAALHCGWRVDIVPDTSYGTYDPRDPEASQTYVFFPPKYIERPPL
jgi:hypothetical protein